MKIFTLPDLGEGLPDAEIRQWHVQVGDSVTADQPMVSMETAKAVVEVPAPRTGRILKLYGKPGDIITTGSPLVEFENGELKDERPDAGTVAGSIEVGNTILEESPTGIMPLRKKSGAEIKALPAIRALAKRLNIDLATVTATGTGGQITTEDVERAQHASTTPQAGFEPLRGVRRTMAVAMAQSHAQVVPVTLVDDADLHTWSATDITSRIIRALIQGCKTEPALNAWYDGKAMSRRLLTEINIGIAMDSDEGLFVPVLKNAANTTATEWRKTIDHYKQEVKQRNIPQEDLQGATIMLSNFGTFAGKYANPIIVPPIVAILGTGRIRQEVVAYQGKPEIHRILPLSLTFDHRAVTGGEATRFLRAVIEDLQNAK